MQLQKIASFADYLDMAIQVILPGPVVCLQCNCP